MTRNFFHSPSQARGFHTSLPLSQRPDHPMYPLVDWTQVRAGKYAVVDPLDPSNILYLTHREYVIQSRVVISNDLALVVLATPRDSGPDIPLSSSSDSEPSSKNTPPASARLRRKTSRLFESTDRMFRIGRLKMAFESILTKYAPFKVGLKKQLKNVRPGTSKGERVVPMIAFTDSNIGELIRDWGALLWFRIFGVKSSPSFGKGLVHLGTRLAILVRHQGALATILILKAEYHAVLSYVSGNPMKSTSELGVRVRLINGLPRSLSAQTRQAIRSGDIKAIRLWLSILNLFRSLGSKYKPATLGAIQFPRWNDCSSAYFEDFQVFLQSWSPRAFKNVFQKGWDKSTFVVTDPYTSSKRGPNGQAMKAARCDLVVWMLRAAHDLGYFKSREITAENMFQEFADFWFYVCENFEEVVATTSLWRYISATGDLQMKANIRNSVMYFDFDLIGPAALNSDLSKLFELDWDYSDGKEKPRFAIGRGLNAPAIAKLVALYEPAGKIRNIVTFDYWSQMLLRPVHDFMFQLLRCLPCDATFDQEGALKSFSERGYMKIYSLDLKSATEYIPQQLYHALMSVLAGSEIAKAWMDLLVDRDILPVKDYWVASRSDTVRYTRGQPMGALSSWASMALVHHAVLQFAAYLVGYDQFEDYLILGDDIIIANELVADAYQKVCDDFGIKIGLAKSFSSDLGFGNFAGQSFLGEKNLSPISSAEELVIRSPFPRAEMVHRILRRGFFELSSPGWFTMFLRYMLSPGAYRAVVGHRAKGIVDPLVPAALTAGFGVPEKLQSLLGSDQKFSISTFFGSLAVTNKVFSMPFEQFWKTFCEDSLWVQEALITASLVKAKLLFKKFLALDERLQELDTILQESPVIYQPSRLFPKETAYLRFVVLPYDTLAKKLEDFKAWERLYVALLERVLAVAESPFLDVQRARSEFGVPLAVVYESLCEAERKLPIAIDSPLGEEVPGLERDPEQGYADLDQLLANLSHLSELASMPDTVLDPTLWEEIWLQEGLTPYTKSH